MYQFTLEWLEGSQLRSKTFLATEEKQLKAVLRAGRDQQCDIVIADDANSVSRIHAEIFFKLEQQNLYLRNATGNRPQPNFVIVDGHKVVKQEAVLKAGSKIQLGKLMLTVQSLEVSQPVASASQNQQLLQHQEYGLQCINGHQVSYDHVRLFCPYCGTALQAVDTVIISSTDQSA